MGISLVTVPLVLHALGQSDFGLYNLIAGIVAMLAFMNGAMTVSTQRYLSVTIGEGNPEKLLQVFNLSLLLHIFIGALIVLLIEACMPLLLRYVLTVDDSQLGVARLLLQCMVVSMFFTIIAVPLDALLNAYENMLFFSIIGILESIFKLLVALSLPLFLYNRLVVYGLLIALVSVTIFIIKFLYCRQKYRHLYPSVSACHNRKLLTKMFSFAGWNTLSALAVVGRVQGLAVIYNHFFGTVINAAYGIANQVNGVMGYFSITIQKSINPQLMKSESDNTVHKQQLLTFALTKYSLLVMCVIAVPLMIEMPFIFGLWLGEIPAFTIEFTRLVILLSLLTQTSAGLMSAIQSSGHVKWYTICISLTLLSSLLIAYALLDSHHSPEWALWGACATELVAVCLRCFFAKRLKSIQITRYFLSSVLPNIILMIFVGAVLSYVTHILDASFSRLALNVGLVLILYPLLGYLLVLNQHERSYLSSLLQRIKSKC